MSTTRGKAPTCCGKEKFSQTYPQIGILHPYGKKRIFLKLPADSIFLPRPGGVGTSGLNPGFPAIHRPNHNNILFFIFIDI
ncbi:hypothetical protein [Paracoccus thiocyanatus]|uniref:hypothetical protein n=1 Tax=Paracoccus thiocyanatus TaxID=34006 RepID=UPI00122C27F7|nr:hypothetical protein [Paracoccus thiocyanatus]